MNNEEVLAKGLAERIGIEGSKLTHEPVGGEKVVFDEPMDNHKVALGILMDALVNPTYGVLKSLDEISACGHRVAHGGEYFSESAVITPYSLKNISACSELAPLHNPANIMGIEACQELLPHAPNVATFDTAFHQTLPDEAFIYPLPYEYYEKYQMRKYGFHGTSHKYVAQKAALLLNKDIKDLKIITCHLGNGASIAAVDGGKSIETSMGFTPLEGLAMGTRCGSIDAAIVPFLVDKEGITADEVNNIMNKKSGVLGISGVSSDFRDIEGAAKEGNKRAQLALDVFVYRVKTTIGAYVAALDGVDAIVFTAGLGENSCSSREAICKGLTYLGIKIDSEANGQRGKELVISTDDSDTKVLVIPTNEELMIARDTLALVK
jgi:acetate kinase